MPAPRGYGQSPMMDGAERGAAGPVFVGMLSEIKRRAVDRMRGDPGRRFQDQYRRHARQKSAHKGGAERILNYALAAVAFVIGGVLVVFPGPAVPFFILGGILLAS